MRRVMKLLGLLAVVGLAGCSIFDKDIKDAPSPLLEFTPKMTVKQLWSVHVGNAESSVFSPVAVAGSVFAAAANGNIYRLDAQTGHEIWNIKAPLELTAGVGADHSTLAVVGEKGILYAYDLDAKLLWQKQLSSEVLATPVVAGGLIVVRSIDNHIAAYNSADGKLAWLVERPLPPLMLRTASAPVINDNLVYVGLPGGKLLAITLKTGSVRWEAMVGVPKGTTEMERVADALSVTEKN